MLKDRGQKVTSRHGQGCALPLPRSCPNLEGRGGATLRRAVLVREGAAAPSWGLRLSLCSVSL